jgi:hypothetical protein
MHNRSQETVGVENARQNYASTQRGRVSGRRARLQPCHKEHKHLRALLMTAKLMSRSVCFEPISKSALYQGTTSVVPKRGQ